MKFIIPILLLFTINLFPQQETVLEEMRGVKLTNVASTVLYSDQNIAEAMDYLSSIGINAVLPVVLNGAYTQYPSAVMDSLFGTSIDPDFNGRDPLERVIIEAHRVGIEVYPWFEYGFAAWYSGGTPPYGGPILQQYPHWACRDLDGSISTKNGFDWMSGINPEVQDFIMKLSREVIENYDVDGIEYSDRLPALPVQGGYDSVTVEIYKSEHSGNEPPAQSNNPDWKRWRADKLNEFYRNVRTMVKTIDTNLFVASSPSIYPWAYDEYLQDSKTWTTDGIIDHFIPQLYRYNLADYIFELDKAINQTPPDRKEIIFAGILMNVGSYTVSPELLLQFMQANRDRGLKGEAFFFYEGLRKNNNLLGDTLRATYYGLPAIMPLRNGNTWRPKGSIANEDTDSAQVTGNWEEYPMTGFNGGILRTDDAINYTAIEYYFDVPGPAWYDVYIYNVPNTIWTDEAQYFIHSGSDSMQVVYDQTQLNKRGWQKIGSVMVSPGMKKVVTLDNGLIDGGEYLAADAVMLLINRRKSPDVFITSIDDKNEKHNAIPTEYLLAQNYPNPFNPATTISFALPEYSDVKLSVFNVLGEKVAELINGAMEAGNHEVRFDASQLPSGIYLYRLQSGSFSETKKMLLLR